MTRSLARLRRRLPVVLVVLFLAVVANRAVGQSANHEIKLSHAEASTDDGRTIVRMVARGDISGTLTLAVTTAADGTITAGEWALAVSYITETHEDGDVEVQSPDVQEEAGQEHHPVVETLIQKGVLKGSVAAGKLVWNSDGKLSLVNNVALTISGGTVDYENVTGGSGTASGWNLEERNTANGALALVF
jgi:hypothetical protein